MGKYQITSYQLIYSNGVMDTVKLVTPVNVDNLEVFRANLKKTHDGCIGVNMTYYELP